MKRKLRSTVVFLWAVPVCVGLAGNPAYAQLLVHDPMNYLELSLQLGQLIQQLQVLRDSYASITHLNPEALAVAPGLLNNAMQLPGSAPGLMPGYNFGSALSAPGQQFYNQNHIYTPHDNDFAAQELQRSQYATANLQGEAQQGLERATERLASLQQLEASIGQQHDIQAAQGITARIESEHNYIANEQANYQRLALMQQTQQRVDQERAMQHNRQILDEWDTAVSAQAWGN